MVGPCSILEKHSANMPIFVHCSDDRETMREKVEEGWESLPQDFINWKDDTTGKIFMKLRYLNRRAQELYNQLPRNMWEVDGLIHMTNQCLVERGDIKGALERSNELAKYVKPSQTWKEYNKTI